MVKTGNVREVEEHVKPIVSRLEQRSFGVLPSFIEPREHGLPETSDFEDGIERKRRLSVPIGCF